MANVKVESVKDKSRFVRSYGILDYEGIMSVLKSGSSVFVYDSKEVELKPQTMWKASKKLSVLVGKKVVAVKGTMDHSKGYLFSVKDS
jgi:hypothetical protein